MDRKTVEYIIVIIAITLAIYLAYSFISYQYEQQEVQFDEIEMYVPASSQYEVSGDSIEFKNPYSFYDLNVSKVDSSDEHVLTLLNYYKHFKMGNLEYLNESCYVVYVDFDEGGFSYHALLIPIDSFDKDSNSFTNESTVWILDGKNKEFVKYSALNVQVVA